MTIPNDILNLADKLDDPSDLDEIVHEAKSHEASAINNEGLESQIQYLLEMYGPEGFKEILNGILESS